MNVAEFVQEFTSATERLLEGSVVGDPDVRGQTLTEEREQSGAPDWPDFAFEYDIENARHRIYGGAQYERLLNEFEYVAHSREFPATSVNEVAAAVGGTAKWHSVPVLEAAASDIVQNKARRTLLPLIDVVLARCSYIMRRLFEISLAVISPPPDQQPPTAAASPSQSPPVPSSGATGLGRLVRFDTFVTQMRDVHSRFVARIELECRAKLRDDLDTFTKVLDWDLVSGYSTPAASSPASASAAAVAAAPAGTSGEELLEVSPEETRTRVVAIMEGRRAPSFEGPRTRRVDEAAAKAVLGMSAKLYAGVRFFFAKYVRTKMNAFFLDPMHRRLRASMLEHFRRLTDDQYEEIFQLGLASLRAAEARLESQLKRCRDSHERFREAASRMRLSSESFHQRFLALNPPSPK